ncbi:MAG TPA: hypothetical protein VD813_01265 [Pseudonocardia sp.]|nr:hypothetical protein [Pseudonocardia sp.]
MRERLRDAVDDGIGCVGNAVGELAIALTACGLLALVWWGYRSAPYPTAAIVAGFGVLAAYGVVVARRPAEASAGRLGAAALGAAGVTVLTLAYLPACGCLG